MLILSYYWDKKEGLSPAAGDSLKCIVHKHIHSVGVVQLSLQARKFLVINICLSHKWSPKSLIPLSL